MGLGIASELMKKCIEFAIQHKFKEISLEVHRDNSSAIHLYEKYGFVYCEGKNDFILMKLNISAQ